MNLTELLLQTMVDDLRLEKTTQGNFVELVIEFLSLASRQSLRCVSKFFYETISADFAGCFSFDIKAFKPSIFFTDACKFEIKQLFCGNILLYDSATKQSHVLATLHDFDRMEREVLIQIEGGSNRVKGCVMFKVMITDGGQRVEELFLTFPKKNLSCFTLYFSESYSPLKEEPPIKRRKGLFYYDSIGQVEQLIELFF